MHGGGAMARTYTDARMVALELQMENALIGTKGSYTAEQSRVDRRKGDRMRGPGAEKLKKKLKAAARAKREQRIAKILRRRKDTADRAPTKWKGRSIGMSHFNSILGYVVDSMEGMRTPYDFLDVGCGEGKVLRAVATSEHSLLFANLCGIEFDKKMASTAARTVPRAKILTNDINDASIYDAVSNVIQHPTFAYVYDGGIFPLNTLKNTISMLHKVLPFGSVVVFVTLVGDADPVYTAKDIVKMVLRGNRFQLFMEQDVQEENAAPNEYTMKAIYFKDKSRAGTRV